MKRVVIVVQGVHGYGTEIKKFMEKYLGYEVLYIENKYSYKNQFQRILNKIYYKPFLKDDIKFVNLRNDAVKKIEEFGKVDAFLCINPEKSSEGIFKYVKKLNIPMICHCWDNSKFITELKDYWHYFNKVSTYSKSDALENNFQFLPNYYSKDLVKLDTPKKYDFFTIVWATPDRVAKLDKLAEELKNNNKSFLFLVYSPPGKEIPSKHLTNINQFISREEVYKYFNESKGIVELKREKILPSGEKIYQDGLTFRAIESLGFREKLITDFQIVKEYDFYNEKNTFILEGEETENQETKEEKKEKEDKEKREKKEKEYKEKFKKFVNEEYQVLDEEIYHKYSGENWIKEIFRGVF